MKVLHVISSLRKAAGTSVFVVDLSNAMADLGVDVTIGEFYVNPSVDMEPSRAVKVEPLENVLVQPPEYDLVHIHGLWEVCLHQAFRWAKNNRLPVVWSPHGMATPWTLRYKFFKKCLGLIFYQWWDLRAASALHVTAQSEAEDMRRLCLKNPLIIAPLGVKMPKPRPLARAPERTRTLLFVSRIQKKKGLPNLVRAWASIAHAGWQVVIAGPDQEGHTKEVQALARKLGVETDFQFVGPVFGDEKERLYEQADLFVLPSYSENFGVVIPEALAAGCPVITTKGTPWAELLGSPEKVNSKPLTVNSTSLTLSGGQCSETERKQPLAAYGLQLTEHAAVGRCGWWVDVGVEPLAEALSEAMGLTDEERRIMGENGQRLVKEKYAWPAIAKQMQEAYVWALEGGVLPTCVRMSCA